MCVLLKKLYGLIISRNICISLVFLVVCNFYRLCDFICWRLLIIGDVWRFLLCLYNVYKSGFGECLLLFVLIISYEIERERKKKKKGIEF